MCFSFLSLQSQNILNAGKGLATYIQRRLVPRHQRTIERDFVSAATASGEETNPEFAALRNLTACSCSRYALYNI